VHENAIDVHVSGSIRSSGNWEAYIITPFLKLVKRFPQAAVLDLGAQLGQYGLLAAKAGAARVIFVEASPHNSNHIMQSLSKNFGIENVGLGKRLALIRNVLGRTSGMAFEPTYVEHNNNGGTAWGLTKSAAIIRNPRRNESSSIITSYEATSLSITADQLLPLLKNFSDVIIKIDIEGGECNAFAGALQLIKTKRVRGLFMEFGQLKKKMHLAECAEMKEAIQLVQKNGLRPRDPLRGPLKCCNDRDIASWSWDVIWT
jgi:FkbM family methyltransferase